MTTATVATAPKTRKPRSRPQRFARLSSDGPVAVLTIRQVSARGKETVEAYALDCFPSEMGGRGLELTKPDGTRYHVRLDGQLSECSCPGFESYGWHEDKATGELISCKHVLAALALEKAGKL